MDKTYEYISDNLFFKVFNAANYRNGYEYDDGINDLRNYIGLDNKQFYCFFTDIKNIFYYLDYGPCFRQVLIPKNIPFVYTSKDCLDKETEVKEFYSDIIELGSIMLWNTKNIKWLIENGADISANNYYIIEWSLMNNFEVFYFLQDYLGDTEIWLNKLKELELRGFI